MKNKIWICHLMLFIWITVLGASQSVPKSMDQESEKIEAKLQPLGFVKLSKNIDIIAADDVSAIGKIHSFLVIGSDEAIGDDENENYIQLLEKGSDDSYRLRKNILLFKDENKEEEMDIEGISVDGDLVYIIGSHSSSRKKVKKIKNNGKLVKYKKNRKKFEKNNFEIENSRSWLYRIQINPDGSFMNKEKISLKEILKNDPALKPFSSIPSKENGIDIEGIAANKGELHIGFRGPKFRKNYVPILKLNFDDQEKNYDLLYIKLGGRGIRDMKYVTNGFLEKKFLILAGPVGDGDFSYQLYYWDGNDVVPGTNRDVDIGKVVLVGEINPPANGKAEGLVVLKDKNKNGYKLIIVYDGVENKDELMQYFRVYNSLSKF